jgi:TatD DNase family protein
MLIDSHSHLLSQFYEEDIADVSERSNGIIVNIVGFDVRSSKEAIARAKINFHFYASVGIHPNDAKETEDFKSIEQLAMDPKVIAIGEIGLDYYRNSTPKTMQINFFEQQIEVAKKLGLPFIVHSRDAFLDTIKVIKNSGYQKCVLHSFDYGIDEAEEALALGCFISFSGMVTFTNKSTLQDVAMIVPINKILFETDSPFLTPSPFRGRRNEPLYVSFIYEKYAELKGLEKPPLEDELLSNFRALFSKFNE